MIDYKFSYFRKPITNRIPYKSIAINDLFKAIRGDYYRSATLEARKVKEASTGEYRAFKAENFDYVTFAGEFQNRSRDGLIRPSGLMCLDIDHEPTEERMQALKRYVILDDNLDVRMIFRSPGGDGWKIIIRNPLHEIDYSQAYKRIKKYFWKTFACEIDNTSDISRACFVCWDPEVWICQDEYLKTLSKKNPALNKLIETLDLELIKPTHEKIN